MLAPDIRVLTHFWPAHAELFTELLGTVDWDTRIKARLTASYGAPYDYSQLTYARRAMHPALVPVLAAVRTTVGFEPDNCLLNYYADGEASMGFHADAREDLVPGTGVVILSLGSPRSLVFRRQTSSRLASHALPAPRQTAREHTVEFRLAPGDLVVMPDAMQDEWQHAIPREPGAGPRISVTFRQLR
jgi:alkylated DNA repair dioxygenase AlkB